MFIPDTGAHSDWLGNADALFAARPTLWTRRPGTLSGTLPEQPGPQQCHAAQERMRRFAPLLAHLFPELRASGGVIDSPLLPVPRLQQALGLPGSAGTLWIKADHSLPIAGSVKARGGFHEVLEVAERLALEQGLLAGAADYRVLAQEEARALFSRHQIAVGSTGNLGMAIGVMAAALGFEAVVHMSAEAKEWKKQRLRARGVQVVEHAGDYAQAVAAGRELAAREARSHFVEDERSLSLRLGYSRAGRQLQAQLAQAGVAVDARHPLFVYLPCGVGGAPAGISLGLKQAFGRHVHCFFAEPAQSPCFLLAMLGRPGAAPSVYDAGLSNHTEADGLAVPRASELAADIMRPLLEGVCTVADDALLRYLYLAQQAESLQLEPSATAGLGGPLALIHSDAGREYLSQWELEDCLHNATHVAWTTGGLYVPRTEYDVFHARGAALQAGATA